MCTKKERFFVKLAALLLRGVWPRLSAICWLPRALLGLNHELQERLGRGGAAAKTYCSLPQMSSLLPLRHFVHVMLAPARGIRNGEAAVKYRCWFCVWTLACLATFFEMFETMRSTHEEYGRGETCKKKLIERKKKNRVGMTQSVVRRCAPCNSHGSESEE